MAIAMGFAGSFHCMGMCGPIAFALPLNRTNTLTKIMGILSYNAGRIFTYTVLGALIGIFGKGLRMGGALQIASIVIGVVILASVLVPMVLKKVKFSSAWYLKLNQWVKEKLAVYLNKRSNSSLAILGLLNGLLPCGLVFSALFASVAFGGMKESILFMVIFGLGTLPMMFALPFISGSISLSIRKRMTKAVPFVMAFFGVLFILRGMSLDIPYVSPPASEDNTEIKSCCHSDDHCAAPEE